MFRKKQSRKVPSINTSSLPDIVFMLLFFFMVTTVMRDDTLKVQVEIPQSIATDKLMDQSLIATIYVGKPVAVAMLGDAERIQIDDQIVPLKSVGEYILKKQSELPPRLRYKFKTVIKADQNMPMRLITLIKEELKIVDMRNIHYACFESSEKI